MAEEDDRRGEDLYPIKILKRKDIEKLAKLKTAAFQEKLRWCSCCTSKEKLERESWKGTVKSYNSYKDDKISACAVIYDNSSTTQEILAAIQLQFKGMPGDRDLPSSIRHEITSGEEVYIEFICVADGARGKGLGAKLMDWAETEARNRHCKFVSLEVMRSNRARRLYEREGYKSLVDPWICCSTLITWCVFGYCGVTEMHKDLL
eukprot:Nk52_evm45s242 gene=Nk52_evmTU45s242